MHIVIKREKMPDILIQIGIGICLFIFFTKICPLVVFDCDDWIHLGTFRLPLPIWRGWNPTKVMPETWMPVAGWIAARMIYPVCGDYVYSVTVVSALIMSLMITGMCISLKKLLSVRLGLEKKEALACEILFLAFHFLIFRNRGTSQCMFTADNLNCIYNYTMPGILNAMVVLILMRFEDMTEEFFSWSGAKKCFFLILLYFALFSNLFHSAITASYAGIALLMGLKCDANGGKKYIIKNMIYILILLAWGVVLLFEANGGRAGVIEEDANFDFWLAVHQLAAIIQAFSKIFVIILILLSAIIIFFIISGKISGQNGIICFGVKLVCSGGMLAIFLLLLNSRLAYMSRIDATYGIWFYLIVITIFAAAYVLKTFSVSPVVLSVLCLLAVFAAAWPDGKFLMSTRGHTEYEICVKLDKYVIDQIVNASNNEISEITIRIPEHSDDSKRLVYNEELGIDIANCLYRQGIIANKPKVYTILDRRMNEILEE